MKKRNMVFALIGLALAAAMVLTGCENPSGDTPPPPSGDSNAIVTLVGLGAWFAAPVKGVAPDTTLTETEQYTGVIAWKDGNDSFTGATFAVSTAYTAVVTLTAKPGFTFTGLAADAFNYTGATSVTFDVNSGTVTIVFPATAGPDDDTIVNILDLTDKVTAPVKDATPVTTFTETDQYTGTIVWQTESGGAVGEKFAAETVYKAVVTLTVKTGYIFTGLAADAFSYTDATSVTFDADSGTVTIVFPETDPIPVLDGTVSIGGNPYVGQTLTANISSLNGTGTPSYQWKRGDSPDGETTNISGETDINYTLTAADLGKYIAVTVTREGYSGSITSAPAKGPVVATITINGINPYYNNQYATFYSSDSSEAVLGENKVVIGSTSSTAISGVQISSGSVTIPVYLVDKVAKTAVPYTGNGQNIKIYVIIKDSTLFTEEEFDDTHGAYTINAVNFTNGSASVDVTNLGGNVLSITGITAALANEGKAGIKIGIFPHGTSIENVMAQNNIVAGAMGSEVTLSSSEPYTATVQLYIVGTDNRWTVGGTFDVYLLLGDDGHGNPTSVYMKTGVEFTPRGIITVPVGTGGFMPPAP